MRSRTRVRKIVMGGRHFCTSGTVSSKLPEVEQRILLRDGVGTERSFLTSKKGLGEIGDSLCEPGTPRTRREVLTFLLVTSRDGIKSDVISFSFHMTNLKR